MKLTLSRLFVALLAAIATKGSAMTEVHISAQQQETLLKALENYQEELSLTVECRTAIFAQIEDTCWIKNAKGQPIGLIADEQVASVLEILKEETFLLRTQTHDDVEFKTYALKIHKKEAGKISIEPLKPIK